jgi:hypothetical protein
MALVCCRLALQRILLTILLNRSFLGQCPPIILTMAIVAWKLHIPSQDSGVKQSQLSKLRRIDFLGAILFPTSLICGLLVLELTGQRIEWTTPIILTLLGASLVSGYCFLMVEAFWAKEPIFPLRLLRSRDVVTSYINLGFQSGAQIAVSRLQNSLELRLTGSCR